ncbi:unnamed protein product, partial [Hymenolepis diminuta]|uniref:GAGE domain-containing protein n=1 Tax=Hymenolepis diminuta TaxID=6216 RepID=A0A0R3SZL4_HYMDI
MSQVLCVFIPLCDCLHFFLETGRPEDGPFDGDQDDHIVIEKKGVEIPGEDGERDVEVLPSEEPGDSTRIGSSNSMPSTASQDEEITP